MSLINVERILKTIDYEETQEKIFDKVKEYSNDATFAILSMRPELNLSEKIYILESLKTHTHIGYAKKILAECLQRIYEHGHFFGGPFPKGIELYNQKGTFSRTPIPLGSKGWIGRFMLIPGDTITGYYVYSKGVGLVFFRT